MTNANDPDIVELRRIHRAVVDFLNDPDGAAEHQAIHPPTDYRGNCPQCVGRRVIEARIQDVVRHMLDGILDDQFTTVPGRETFSATVEAATVAKRPPAHRDIVAIHVDFAMLAYDRLADQGFLQRIVDIVLEAKRRGITDPSLIDLNIVFQPPDREP